MLSNGRLTESQPHKQLGHGVDASGRRGSLQLSELRASWSSTGFHGRAGVPPEPGAPLGAMENLSSSSQTVAQRSGQPVESLCCSEETIAVQCTVGHSRTKRSVGGAGLRRGTNQSVALAQEMRIASWLCSLHRVQPWRTFSVAAVLGWFTAGRQGGCSWRQLLLQLATRRRTSAKP